jgi:DNA repair protein RecN (Recombination protein N)
VLSELRVENLLLIERAEMRFDGGLNVITGETGAGKTVLAHALDLLLGGKARPAIVRPGAKEAYVEGVFELTEALREEFADLLPEGAEEAVLARRVGRDGRTRAQINGRTVGIADLRRAGEALLAFYGQHEHRKLTIGAAQMEILDGCGGEKQAERRRECAGAYAQAREARERVERLRGIESEREREIDLIEHEIGEIEAADPSEGEQERLKERRERLRMLGALTAAAGAAAEAIGGGESMDGGDAAARSAQAAARIEAVAGVDTRLDALGERARAIAIEASDLAGELSGYRESLQNEAESADEDGGGGIDALEERLGTLERLMRKHGGTIEEVLAYGERARERRDEMRGAEQAKGEAEKELETSEARLQAAVEALRKAREEAAPKLAEAVRKELSALAMKDAKFAVKLTEREPGPSGADAVEFEIAPNPGVPAGPLKEIASGGELSRVMLALTTVSTRSPGRSTVATPPKKAADPVPRPARDNRVKTAAPQTAAASAKATLVFDEVDAGIGGQTARTVGERLLNLAAGRQILCITHLPQIAALGERHFAVVKSQEGGETQTTVHELAEDGLLDELVRMLGASPEDGPAREHARRLRRKT